MSVSGLYTLHVGEDVALFRNICSYSWGVSSFFISSSTLNVSSRRAAAHVTSHARSVEVLKEEINCELVIILRGVKKKIIYMILTTQIPR